MGRVTDWMADEPTVTNVVRGILIRTVMWLSWVRRECHAAGVLETKTRRCLEILPLSDTFVTQRNIRNPRCGRFSKPRYENRPA